MAEAASHPRHAGIELGRAVAMLAVVLIHVPPPPAWNALLRPLAEFGVPYFFVVSGFLWARGHLARRSARLAPVSPASPASPLPPGSAAPSTRAWSAWRAALGPLPRLLGLYALGFVAYSLLPLDWLTALLHRRLLASVAATAQATLTALARAPLGTLFDGPPGGFHLWFLASLALGLGTVMLGVRLRRARLLGGTAVALFVFGLLAGRYAATPLGIPLGWSVRNGPFQAVLLVGVGALLAQRMSAQELAREPANGGPRVRRGWGPLGLALGWLIAFAERHALGAIEAQPGEPDVYSLAVLPLGLGAFFCFHDLRITSPRVRRAATWLGGTTLGVYLWHVLLRVPLASVLAVLGLYPARGTNPTWGFAALFALSVLCVLLWRTGLRLCAHGRRRWSGRGAGRGGLDQRPPIELEGV
ncbi:MAG: acyltransferase [Sandaracinaceae bacterium]|nr:acyltransferase [Sandaracinaceae bacterium]